MQFSKTVELHLVMNLIRMSMDVASTHPKKTSPPEARITEEDDQVIVSGTVDDV